MNTFPGVWRCSGVLAVTPLMTPGHEPVNLISIHYEVIDTFVKKLLLVIFFNQVVPVMLNLLTSISSVRLYIPKDLRPYDNRQSMLKSIQVQYSRQVYFLKKM